MRLIFPKQFIAVCTKAIAGRQIGFPNKVVLWVAFCFFPTSSPEETVIMVFHLIRNSRLHIIMMLFLLYFAQAQQKPHSKRKTNYILKDWQRWAVSVGPQNPRFGIVRQALCSFRTPLCTDTNREVVVALEISFLLFVSVMRTKMEGQELACWD